MNNCCTNHVNIYPDTTYTFVTCYCYISQVFLSNLHITGTSTSVPDFLDESHGKSDSSDS